MLFDMTVAYRLINISSCFQPLHIESTINVDMLGNSEL